MVSFSGVCPARDDVNNAASDLRLIAGTQITRQHQNELFLHFRQLFAQGPDVQLFFAALIASQGNVTPPATIVPDCLVSQRVRESIAARMRAGFVH